MRRLQVKLDLYAVALGFLCQRHYVGLWPTVLAVTVFVLAISVLAEAWVWFTGTRHAV